MPEHILSADQVTELIARVFPQAAGFAEIVRLGEGTIDVQLSDDGSGRTLRPGDTVSGPAQMTLCDTAAYLLLLSMIGERPLAVTTQLSINFMRKAPASNLNAHARMLKLGKRLAVMDVLLTSDAQAAGPIAHAQVTYSIPPA